MKSRLSLIVAALLFLPLLSSCSGNDDRSTIYASFYPLQFVAQQVVGDRFDVVNLTKPGMEPHDTELSIRQIGDLGDAELVVYSRGFAPAVDDAVDTADPAQVVDAANAAKLVDDDPHFWLDPTRLADVTAEVADAISTADPAHADAYQKNAAELIDQLHQLDRELMAGLAHCKIHTVVVSHDAFEYFGRRYGLQMAPINGLSPDAEPSPAHIAQLHDLIKSDGVTTVFSEELASPALADGLAHDLGLKTAVLDPIEGLSEESSGANYLSLMRKNLAAIQEANRCT